jgi:hypothetical protein
MPDNLIGPRGGLGPQGFRGPAGPTGPAGPINTASNYNWTGVNTFVTQNNTDNSDRVATTAFVANSIALKSDLSVKVITSAADLDTNNCYNINNLPNGNCTIINKLISTKSTVSGAVNSMCRIGKIIYVGGNFTTFNNNDGQGNITTNNICKYDTEALTFSTMGGFGLYTGVNSAVRALCAIDKTLYIGGNFTTFNNGTGPTTTNYICKYDTGASTFSTMNNLPELNTSTSTGMYNSVIAICAINTTLYIGGSFTTFNNGGGNTTTNRICKYDTGASTFSTMNNLPELNTLTSTGVGAIVNTLCVIDTTLYVGGDFTTFNNGTGNTTTNRICKYDTGASTFSTMNNIANPSTLTNTGVSATVYALYVINKTLYVAGGFTTFNNGGGNTTTNFICKYDTTFSTMGGSGSNTGVSAAVYALCAINTTLYIGGNFTAFNNGIENIISNGMCKYDTATSTFSTNLSMTSSVLALYEYSGIIYYGGNFLTVNNKPYSYFFSGKTFNELRYNNTFVCFIEASSFENINVTSYDNKKCIYVPSINIKCII